MSSPRVLVTGAAGGVASMLLPGLRDSWDLVLTDRVPVPGGLVGDLTDSDFVAKITEGVDAVVHLAACPDPTRAGTICGPPMSRRSRPSWRPVCPGSSSRARHT